MFSVAFVHLHWYFVWIAFVWIAFWLWCCCWWSQLSSNKNIYIFWKTKQKTVQKNSSQNQWYLIIISDQSFWIWSRRTRNLSRMQHCIKQYEIFAEKCLPWEIMNSKQIISQYIIDCMPIKPITHILMSKLALHYQTMDT